MEKLIVNKGGSLVIPLTEEEIENLSILELEQSLLPAQEEIEEAEFKIKLITKLAEWGILQ